LPKKVYQPVGTEPSSDTKGWSLPQSNVGSSRLGWTVKGKRWSRWIHSKEGKDWQ